jgi:hypothetical protein
MIEIKEDMGAGCGRLVRIFAGRASGCPEH